MKRLTAFILLVAFVMCSGELSAQNKKGVKGGTTKVTTEKKEKVQPFTGAIEYILTPLDNYKRRDPKAPQEAKENALNFGPNDKDKKDKKKEETPGTTSLFFFTKEGSYAFFDNLCVFYTGEKTPKYILEIDDGHFVASELEPMEWEKQGAEKAKSLYTKEKHTRMIGGVKATRYTCNIPHMKGDVWVAEEYTIDGSVAPYFGLNHPVLEGDFIIVMDNEPMRMYHFQAKTMIPEKIDTDRLEKINNSEPIVPEDMDHRLREMFEM